MKRIAATAFLVVVLLPAWGSAFDCAPGRYEGRTWSVTKPLSGHAATLTVTERDGLCVMRFDCPSAGARELWELKENKLRQVELDASGKEVQKYGATLEVRDGVEGYYIDCKGGTCDAGVDSRYFWRIRSSGNKIIYSVWGVAPDRQSDLKVRATKRHEYTFTRFK